MSIRYAIRIVTLVAAVTGGTMLAHADDYTVDDQHTSVVFAVNHMEYSYTYGMFGKYRGQFSYDPQNATASSFRFAIDAASLDTKSEKRDEHLRGPDFFNVKQFPEITFKSTSVAAKDGKLMVTGTMTLHGVSKEIVMPLSPMKSGPGPDQKQHTGFLGQFKVKRSEFGMNFGLPHIGDEVSIILSFEGIKQ